MFYFCIKLIFWNRVFIAINKKVRLVFNLIGITNRAEYVSPFDLIISSSFNP